MNLIHSDGLTRALNPGSKPALIILDAIRAYTDPHSPFFHRHCSYVLDRILAVREFARSNGVPIVSTRLEFQNMEDKGASLFIEKIPALKELRLGSEWAQYSSEKLAPGDALNSHSTEIIKQVHSAFFGTVLERLLREWECDTVFIVGYLTSGAVRATSLDAMQHGFRPFILQDAVADRSSEANKLSLYDIQHQCGEVVSLQRAKSIYDEMVLPHGIAGVYKKQQ